MLEKELLLAELQEKLHNTKDDQTKMLLNELIGNITSGVYNIRVW
ncbi:hypothetical protein [Bacillus xiapuensis]|uniref:Uncharacterized protein n=1 Tax=Bacillus xiapuensis TaxID=2014075 RepID=A0ABU6N814_9BACI|nr:hypothetical protein [Bacillus xiapuensis]